MKLAGIWLCIAGLALAVGGAIGANTGASAQVLALAIQQNNASAESEPTVDGGTPAAVDEAAGLRADLRRQVVNYPTTEPPGTIIIDSRNTHLYLVLGGGKAIRYGVGVGREGFTWSGTKTIERKSEWPDWIPPAEMVQRQPYLPRFMAGGPGNPLGARAMYLSGTVFRIHGTNKPSSIGTHTSSGCIRMLNADVIDLYERTHIGTKVVVLPAGSAQPSHERTAQSDSTAAFIH